MTAQSTYSITAHDLVQQRNVELGEAISELIRAYQYGPNLYTGRTIAQLHRINADVGRATNSGQRSPPGTDSARARALGRMWRFRLEGRGDERRTGGTLDRQSVPLP